LGYGVSTHYIVGSIYLQCWRVLAMIAFFIKHRSHCVVV